MLEQALLNCVHVVDSESIPSIRHQASVVGRPPVIDVFGFAQLADLEILFRPLLLSHRPTGMASAVGAMDEAIREYLLFRGFTAALKAFDHDLKTDRDKNLKVR